MKNCFKASLFFCTLSCQNTANTGVFGWFALGGNTGIYETFSAPCQKKNIAKKKNVLKRIHSNTVDCGVLDEFCP